MHPDIHAHRLLILDFGSQYTQLIARRVREVGVYSEIHPWDMAQDDIRAFQPSGIILSGGPASVHVDGAPQLDARIYDLGIPIFGICYGAQLIAQQLGGVKTLGQSEVQDLVSMRERAARIGARLEVQSAPGEGTTVTVRT